MKKKNEKSKIAFIDVWFGLDGGGLGLQKLTSEVHFCNSWGRKAAETAQIAPECQSEPPRSPILDFLGPFEAKRGDPDCKITKIDFPKSIIDFFGARNGATRIAQIAQIENFDFLGSETERLGLLGLQKLTFQSQLL